ncbi:MAG: transporter substrate-binding domain-containing protein [Tannerellaceae bacterium]|jgi:membrane-bound lytic murein transglycosylase F|nr:transporter substrate-binding domain-containing protein [Tannerellaceae bacterium]
MKKTDTCALLLCLLPVIMCAGGCRAGEKPHGGDNERVAADFPQIMEKGYLTAVTLYSSTSYFLYRTEPMGYEYELINDFAASHGLKLIIKVAEDSSHLIEMLQNGEADVVAYPIVYNQELKREVAYCGRLSTSTQTLVQPAGDGVKPLTDVTQLIGKDVYVGRGTPYYDRLVNLDKELGGGIRIHEAEGDTGVEDLIEMVSARKIPYTVSDDRTARLNRTYYRNLDVSLDISFRQRSSWVVRRNSPRLSAAINRWASGRAADDSFKASAKRYFVMSKKILELSMPEIKKGHISPYDSLFRQHAATLGWDWRLLAALAYQESHFRNTVTSWAGASGVMGIMPSTARTLRIPIDHLTDPEVNIRAGVEVLRLFREGLSEITDTTELVRFTLAAYNAGIGHVYDARRLAAKYGKDPSVWNNNVDSFILLKQEPAFYNDASCRYGYLRGRETFNYVREILGRYEYYCRQTQQSPSI